MKAIKIAKYTLLITGIGMLVGAFFFYQSTQKFIDESTTSEGKVIDLIMQGSGNSDGYTSYYYYPLIEFKTQEGELIKFQSTYGSNPPSYSLNEAVEVLYDPETPENAKVKSFVSLWLTSLILAIVGGVNLALGLGVIVFNRIKEKKILWLKQFGHRIQTKFQTVVHNIGYKVNGRSPYQIISQGHENGQVYVFKSENLWFDPTVHLQKDQEITVLVDPQNMKKYWMDTSFLPELRN